MLVCAVVVCDRMNSGLSRNLPVDLLQKLQPLLVAMSVHAAADDFSIQRVKCGEQYNHAVALIVVGHRAAVFPFRGKNGCEGSSA